MAMWGQFNVLRNIVVGIMHGNESRNASTFLARLEACEGKQTQDVDILRL
jgi:hypothetical protein